MWNGRLKAALQNFQFLRCKWRLGGLFGTLVTHSLDGFYVFTPPQTQKCLICFRTTNEMNKNKPKCQMQFTLKEFVENTVKPQRL